MSTVQYVRAGACLSGQSLGTSLVDCATSFTDCPAGTFFHSANQLTQALASPGAVCLQAEHTNDVLAGQCGGGSNGSSTLTGACLVEDFDAQDVYHCAVSKEGCAAGDLYLTPSDLAQASAAAGISCQLCGLTASSDYNLDDVKAADSHNGNLYDRLVGDDTTRQLEAAGIAGIVVGIVVGCGLLLCVQRMCCRRGGSGRRNNNNLGKQADLDKTSDGGSSGGADSGKDLV